MKNLLKTYTITTLAGLSLLGCVASESTLIERVNSSGIHFEFDRNMNKSKNPLETYLLSLNGRITNINRSIYKFENLKVLPNKRTKKKCYIRNIRSMSPRISSAINELDRMDGKLNGRFDIKLLKSKKSRRLIEHIVKDAEKISMWNKSLHDFTRVLDVKVYYHYLNPKAKAKADSALQMTIEDFQKEFDIRITPHVQKLDYDKRYISKEKYIKLKADQPKNIDVMLIYSSSTMIAKMDDEEIITHLGLTFYGRGIATVFEVPNYSTSENFETTRHEFGHIFYILYHEKKDSTAVMYPKQGSGHHHWTDKSKSIIRKHKWTKWKR